MERRRFLTLTGVALTCTQLPAWATTVSKPTLPREGQKHLDVHQAKRITVELLEIEREERLITSDPIMMLDLEEYSSASLGALKYLAPLNGSFAVFGFENISPEMAKIISEWNTYGLIFSKLQNLCGDSAKYLGCKERGHLLSFQNPVSIDASAARALICAGSVLDLHLQGVLSLSLARALADHQHELDLAIPCGIQSPLVARSLSLHAGYALRISIPSRPSESVLQQFGSNANKRLTLMSPDESNQIAGVSNLHMNWKIILNAVGTNQSGHERVIL